MSQTAATLVQNIQNARLAYTQSDEISILMNDWGKLTTEAWFDNGIQKMVSVSASMATAKFNVAVSDQGNFSPTMALFDARVFNIPKEEVANYFIWRQQDATRNSINMLGQFYFSHKELQGKTTDEVQEMLFSKHGVNWNDIPTWQKRGYCATRRGTNNEIPIFTKERQFIEQHLAEDEVE
jgi:tRNA(His) 5'-end guanylyltransferase